MVQEVTTAGLVGLIGETEALEGNGEADEGWESKAESTAEGLLSGTFESPSPSTSVLDAGRRSELIERMREHSLLGKGGLT